MPTIIERDGIDMLDIYEQFLIHAPEVPEWFEVPTDDLVRPERPVRPHADAHGPLYRAWDLVEYYVREQLPLDAHEWTAEELLDDCVQTVAPNDDDHSFPEFVDLFAEHGDAMASYIFNVAKFNQAYAEYKDKAQHRTTEERYIAWRFHYAQAMVHQYSAALAEMRKQQTPPQQ